MTIGNILTFLDLIFLCIVCVFVWRNLEKLTSYLERQYPDTWITLGSVRFSKKGIPNSPQGAWYTWINVIPLYKFLRFGYVKLPDQEVKTLVKSIHKNLLLLLIGVVVFIFKIRYL